MKRLEQGCGAKNVICLVKVLLCLNWSTLYTYKTSMPRRSDVEKQVETLLN